MARFLTILALAGMAFAINLLADMGSSFAVVVHHSNPMSSIRFTDLQLFFSGEIRSWPDGIKLVLVERDLESAVFRFLMQHILNTTPVEYQRHMANLDLKGRAPMMLRILNSDAAACKFVFNVPGAIAVIATNSLALPECSTVQLVSVDGRLPGDDKYRLR